MFYYSKPILGIQFDLNFQGVISMISLIVRLIDLALSFFNDFSTLVNVFNFTVLSFEAIIFVLILHKAFNYTAIFIIALEVFIIFLTIILMTFLGNCFII